MARAASKNPAARRLRKPALDFSLTGLIYSAMMLFMGLAAINSQANLLFAVFGLMIGVLLVSGVISRLVLKRLEVHRTLPEHGVAGRRTTWHYRVTNAKRFWPSLSVQFTELDAGDAFTRPPQAYMLHVAARQTAMVPVEVIPARRGLHPLGEFQLITSFPFGFIKRAIVMKREESFLVYPPLAEVDPKLLGLFLSAEKSGARMRPRRGGYDEFYGVKDYRGGENPRWIYWRRSARTGRLVSREMSAVAPPRLLIVLDAQPRGWTAEELAAAEKSIAIAASLAAAALARGLSVGLAAWDGGLVEISPSRGKRHRRELLEALARLDLRSGGPAFDATKALVELARPGTTAVLVRARDGGREGVEPSRQARMTIAAESEQTDRWFTFERGVDFAAIGRVMAASGPPSAGGRVMGRPARAVGAGA